MDTKSDCYYHNSVRSGSAINSTKDKIIEHQPKNNNSIVDNSDKNKETRFNNEDKCKYINRQFIGCLHHYDGNFFYCNNLYKLYMGCMDLSKINKVH